jgi:hypothetical protein
MLFHFGGDRFGALEAEVIDHNAARIVLSESQRDCAADTLTRASHKRDASF